MATLIVTITTDAPNSLARSIRHLAKNTCMACMDDVTSPVHDASSDTSRILPTQYHEAVTFSDDSRMGITILDGEGKII